MTQTELDPAPQAAIQYADLSSKLSLGDADKNDRDNVGTAVRATFITPLDPVIETADGNRLPAVPLHEAHKINVLKAKAEGKGEQSASNGNDGSKGKHMVKGHNGDTGAQDNQLDSAIPPLRTHPLFPPLPLYGPPTLLRNAQCLFLRITSFYLSTGFLLVIVLGAVFTSIPRIVSWLWLRSTFRNPDRRRSSYEEEQRRAIVRKREEKEWRRKRRQRRSPHQSGSRSSASSPAPGLQYEPTEGGPDKLVCDASYYARRVGLDMEKFKVQTEDGFIIDLWHVYDPTECTPSSARQKQEQGPKIFGKATLGSKQKPSQNKQKRYPVLLIHGLLQSAGAYCCNDDESLAFYLHKAGYDVWLGNNRCGFKPQHTLLKYVDPRMWAWNIRQMGVMDLPALVSRVLGETGFAKLGLVAHSQGTTQTFVALAKDQRPDLGEKISVFCALAPAVYAGPLIGKMYFKFMRAISPAMFRIFFGIHAFIPLMMTMHSILPARMYGLMGYLVFGFLFDWSDARWDRALRDRFFQFAPVYVSAESMRWWLGRECFAKHKCILSTQEEYIREENEDWGERSDDEKKEQDEASSKTKGRTAWYDARAPPFALWVAGSDALVDGKRLLRRFERGREPYVNVVHTKVIEEYEHLDVLWAMDSIAQVGSEVKDVLWKTMSSEDKDRCRDIQGVNQT